MNDKRKKLQITGLEILFFLSIIAVGGFYEYLSCAMGVLLLIWIVVRVKKEKSFKIKSNLISISLAVLVVFYLLGILWAVDSGMAAFGVLKYAPVLFFTLALMQEEESGEKIKEWIPYVAAILTVISGIGMLIPATNEFFTVAGRFAGGFQYPNTFALFLLVAELLLISKQTIKKWEICPLLLLAAGILATGSRTVFVLAVAANFGILFTVTDKKRRKRMAVIYFVVIVLGICALAAAGKLGIGSRFLQISLNESTFVGRLLYYQDALPLVHSHPFGLGYMGHYYMQQSIQTGLYSILYIHNDFLQILLDVGWIPFVIVAAAIVKSFMSKKVKMNEKLILAVIVLHSCLDFNLQFIAVFCMMILFMDYKSGKEYQIKEKKGFVPVVLVVMVVFLYGGLVSALAYGGQCELVHALYPWHTQNEIQRLTMTEDLDEMNEIADHILAQNEYVTVAYSAKARYAYSRGDFGQLIQIKNQIFEVSPFQYDEYEEYCYMLINGIYLYQQAGDKDSVRICERELRATQKKLGRLEKSMSELGKKIKDQPQMELPEEIVEYINEM